MTQEVYALATNRTAATANAFLDEFLPKRLSFSDEYLVPESSDEPTNVFTTTIALMDYLETNPTEAYGLYWNSASDPAPIRQAMLFYTTDCHLILGLATVPNEAGRILDRLVRFAGTGIGMLGSESRPPETAVEFCLWSQSTGSTLDGLLPK